MKRRMMHRRSRPRASIEVSANDDGTLSASPVRDIPRPPLPFAQRPLRCALGRHVRVTLWDKNLGEPAWWPARWATRCRRCGVLLR